MRFWEKIKELFGEEKPIEGLFSPDILDVSLPEHHESIGDRILNLASMGEMPAVYMSELLIDFIEETKPPCSNRQYIVYIWDKVKKGIKNPYGISDRVYMVDGTKNGVYIDGKKIFRKAKLISEDFTAYVSKDPLTESLYKKTLNENMAFARIIELISNNEVYGWKTVKDKFSENPIIALGQARIKYGEKLGGVSSGRLYYPNPLKMFNNSFFLKAIDEKKGFEKNQYRHIYDTITKLEDGFAYGMSVNGKVMELKEKLARDMRYLMKEVIVPYELVPTSWKKDIDFVEIEGAVVSTLATVILTLQEDGKVYLGYSNASTRLEKSIDKKLLEVKLKRTHISDIMVKFTHNKENIWAKYILTKWKEDLPPLVFEEHYTIESFKDNVAVVMHP